ncbi:MAG: PDZ domain-containing protein [Planctomycetaceae bacterium]|nr:PDZ domain-containing protein [Planctomycetaceae bacterium]
MTVSKKIQKICFRFVFLFLFFVVAATVTQQASAQKIHLVIAADINAEGGVDAFVKIDQHKIKQLFESNIPDSQLKITMISAEEMQGSNILKTIDSLEISNEDTIVFYYSGHGGFDRQKQEQFLQLKLGNLYRPELLKHIQQKQPRLSVLLTDCCNVQIDVMGTVQERQSEVITFPQEISPLFATLFFHCKGIVDITSSKLGEYSGCDVKKNRGSCFTYPFVDLMKAHKDNVEMDWDKFVAELAPKVDEAFKECYPNGCRGQMSQTIAAFSYPGKQEPSEPTHTNQPSTDAKKGYRFGVRAVPHQGGGMRMLEIIENSPAQRSGLEVGDVILEINGKTINTEQEYSDAVDASGQKMQVKLINTRDGKTITPTIELGW